MSKLAEDIWFAGVDGCRGGWIAAFLRPANGAGHFEIFARFEDVLTAPQQAAVVAVDIPIGLPERTGAGGRAAENAVRPLLGGRQSSVFSVPARAAIYESDYAGACRTALATSDPPRKVSRQLFKIAAKIREVDEVLLGDPASTQRVYEVHPELAFWRLNGERALTEPKRMKSRPYPPGLDLRRKLLLAAGLPDTLVHARPSRGAAEDDLIDALACAAVARRLHAGLARPHPDPPPRDAFGLPMAIWA
jgi:predicted RNase H-like nuclease